MQIEGPVGHSWTDVLQVTEQGPPKSDSGTLKSRVPSIFVPCTFSVLRLSWGQLIQSMGGPGLGAEKALSLGSVGSHLVS